MRGVKQPRMWDKTHACVWWDSWICVLVPFGVHLSVCVSLCAFTQCVASLLLIKIRLWRCMPHLLDMCHMPHLCVCSFMRVINHLKRVWYDSLRSACYHFFMCIMRDIVCVKWPSSYAFISCRSCHIIQDRTHNVFQKSFIRVCHDAFTVWHDSFVFVCNDSFTYVTWLIYMWVRIILGFRQTRMWDTTPLNTFTTTPLYVQHKLCHVT